ncbi:hypothetical protein [Desulfonema limicola]|nr:hypothetical protein [Desulfonema limicola]
MKNAESKQNIKPISLIPSNIPEEITENDRNYFFKVSSIDLNEQQKQQILSPENIYPGQKRVLAVHWHPEFIPMEYIRQRIETMFPNKIQELIIPTQHNEIMSYDEYSGVEVDCYSSGFNQKVQLLLHFENANIEKADVLKKMLAHTFKYRSSQLFEFIETLTKPVEERIELAAKQTGANESLISFVRIYVKKIETLLNDNIADISHWAVKNKLLRNFFECLRADYSDTLIDRAQIFLTAVKKIVKDNFSFSYFYRTSEIIEEARSLNAGIVIPHPEQFWPVLLAGYDVDGIEVWNPQSNRYTEFLVSVLNAKNHQAGTSKKQLLVFMGDDTHMGEKILEPGRQNPEKALREIGLQTAWDDLNIRKTLILANFNRERVIEEYKSRLAG